MLGPVEDFCRLVLLRHPELAPGHTDVVVGGGEAPLARRGLERAARWDRQLGALELDAVFAADVSQCLDAGKVLAHARGLEVRPEPRLRDQAMGRWQGQRWNEVAAAEPDAVRDFFAQFGDFKAPDGESLGAAVERVLAWWQEVAPHALSQTVAVVMAGNLISGFVAALLGMRLSRAVSLSLPHGALGVIDVYGNGVRLAAWHVDALREDVA
ncbi:MAG: histidine phosphatase family protein [Planctomycetota bacterium]